MSFSPGTKLGRYEIRSKLGAGGMGDVYLARDRSINRDLALKVLPAAFSGDRERLQRFKQEAQAAASLNHPNIAHIYEIGESEGSHFIAMEYIDGPTLREAIRAEQANLRKLLRYLQRAAEGLAKAHAAGIVHRNLPGWRKLWRNDQSSLIIWSLMLVSITFDPTRVTPSYWDAWVLNR